MKLITEQEATGWLADRSLQRPHEIYAGWIAGYNARYQIPCDSGRKTALARGIISGLYEDQSTLFCVVEHGVWSSSENVFLFERFRASAGDDRTLEEASCHLLTPADSDYIEGLLALALYFVWGAFVVDSNGTLVVTINDDEILTVSTNSKSHFEFAQKLMDWLQLVQL